MPTLSSFRSDSLHRRLRANYAGKSIHCGRRRRLTNQLRARRTSLCGAPASARYLLSRAISPLLTHPLAGSPVARVALHLDLDLDLCFGLGGDVESIASASGTRPRGRSIGAVEAATLKADSLVAEAINHCQTAPTVMWQLGWRRQKR